MPLQLGIVCYVESEAVYTNSTLYYLLILSILKINGKPLYRGNCSVDFNLPGSTIQAIYPNDIQMHRDKLAADCSLLE